MKDKNKYKRQTNKKIFFYINFSKDIININMI